MNKTEHLLELARTARNQAYAPYSHFKVGAAVLSTAGKYYSGCNVENISFPVGTCAEAGAIAAMIAGGDSAIAEILIVADASSLIKPCGACLQRIAEFAVPQTIIHLANTGGIRASYPLTEFLPLAFNAEELHR